MLSFNNFINEEINIGKLSKEEFMKLTEKVKKNLDAYKFSILDNIEYNIKTNKVEYKKFDNIDLGQIISQLNTDLGKDIVEQFNIDSFLRKIQQILDLKKRNTKRKIKEEFIEYYMSLDERFKETKEDEREEDRFDKIEGETSLLTKRKYEEEKYDIQIELLKLQEWVVKNGERIAIVFEGRDSAGKGSTIKRFTEYLNPKHYRVVALGLPTEEEKKNWFGRYVKYWKFSPNDAKVIDKWDIITKYKNQMFNKTSTNRNPWVIINSNDKKIGRLNAMRYVLSLFDYDGKNDEMSKYFTEVVNVLK